MINNRSILNVVISLACFTGAVGAATVYDNTTINLNTRLGAGTTEIGDEIILAGTERSLTSFTFQYYLQGSTAGNETLRLRFYQQDGLPAVGGGLQPGALLFDTGPFIVPATAGSSVEITDFSLGSGALLPFTSLLPDRFTWSLQFSGVGPGETAGVNLFGPPSIGNGIVDYWENSGGWINKAAFGGNPPLFPTDFAATVQAVPEPSVMALLLAGGVAVVWQRRRRTPSGRV